MLHYIYHTCVLHIVHKLLYMNCTLRYKRDRAHRRSAKATTCSAPRLTSRRVRCRSRSEAALRGSCSGAARRVLKVVRVDEQYMYMYCTVVSVDVRVERAETNKRFALRHEIVFARSFVSARRTDARKGHIRRLKLRRVRVRE